MHGAVSQSTRPHRLTMPWGLLAGLEVVAFAVVSGWLVLDLFPSVFDVEWGCSGTTGSMHSSADTYIAVFTVVGALGWLGAAAATAVLHAAGRRAVALAIPFAWFAALTLAALATAVAIGPITC